MIYYQDPNVTIYNGHALDVLAELREESIQCVVTSPPYWGLRKYEGDQDRIWGGKPDCEHEWTGKGLVSDVRESTVTGKSRTTDRYYGQQSRRFNGNHQRHYSDNFCQNCGAWRGAFGLEPNPQMYVEHSIEFLRAIWRVLRKDGVVFWNIGDSYYNLPPYSNPPESLNFDARNPIRSSIRKLEKHETLKIKDLCLIPERLTIAAQDDGWWIRSIIIWSKPNPMPESVRDRPTTSHEYILMLTKSGRYYWHKEAVQEQGVMVAGDSSGSRQVDTSIHYGVGGGNSGLNKAKERLSAELKEDGCSTRNVRSVWEFPSKPYAKAHFAVFPEELPKRCILAATKDNDTLLDPFAGTGTSGLVARKLGRKSILIDISETYCEMAKDCMNSLPVPIM